MQEIIVLAVLITPTHGSFIIKLHILIAPVELSHFTVWIFNFLIYFIGEGRRLKWAFLYILSILVHLTSSYLGEELKETDANRVAE